MPRNEGANFKWQKYRGIDFKLIDRVYGNAKAKRFVIRPHTSVGSNSQNVWIPNKHLEEDGTLKPDEDIDYVFRQAQRQLELAGYCHPIPGVKRRTDVPVKPSLRMQGRC